MIAKLAQGLGRVYWEVESGLWKDMSQYPPALITSLTCVWLSSTIRFAFAEVFTEDVLDSRFFPLVNQESMQIA